MKVRELRAEKRFCKFLQDVFLLKLSAKNLRLTSLLVAIYQLLIAQLLLFGVLLGLAHAKQMEHLLNIDIEDQEDGGTFEWNIVSNRNRLVSASELVTMTEVFLYILTGIVSIYLLSCLLLFVGVFKNRAKLIVPWLVVEFVFMTTGIAGMLWFQNEKLIAFLGGKIIYFGICMTFILFDFGLWHIVHLFYERLCEMNKLTEIATVAIPCPPPGSIPFQFRRENMYIGSNGYKHVLTEAPDGNI